MRKTLFIFLNLLALAALLLACLSWYINPKHYWQLAFIGFAFPLVLVVNTLFLPGWILAGKKFALLPLLAIACCYPFIRSSFAFRFKEHNKAGGIKMMTWNVKAFDLYNWSHNTETRSKMMALIKKENPDILCLQEFYSNNQIFHNTGYLRDTLGYKYCYFPPAVELLKYPRSKLQQTLWHSGPLNQQWGVATFSKYPVTDTGKIDFGKTLSNACIYTNVHVKGKDIRVYNVHFQSIHLGDDDYATLDSLEEKQETHWLGIKSIMRKMKLAYTRRAKQAEDVAQNMQAYDGLKIVCGDFNDVPVSYTYHTVSQTMQDAFIEKGSGFSTTFSNKLSFFRIDYALFDPTLQINSYHTDPVELSDHYPVIVTFE